MQVILQKTAGTSNRDACPVVEKRLHPLFIQVCGVCVTLRHGEALWPRATLQEYFELLAALQENMREYEELQVSTYPLCHLPTASINSVLHGALPYGYRSR